MASKTLVTLIDDIDGREIDNQGGTVEFSFEGVSYHIDLASKNLQKFRKVIDPYISAATRVGGRTSKGRRSRSAPIATKPQEIREWARSNGWEVSDRGRVPGAILSAYAAAHQV